MPDRAPTETTNLDIYGDAVLPWSRPYDLSVATAEPSGGTRWRFGQEA